MNPVDALTVVLLVAGSALALVGAFGTHRFTDTFARMHAATKPVTLGVLLIGTGAALQAGDGGDVAKIALAMLLQLVTAPLGMHLLGRAAARRAGLALPDDDR